MTDQPTKDCEAIRALLREYTLRTLEAGQAARVEEHLRTCPQCGAAHGAEVEALSLLESLAPIATPEGLADRTLARIRWAQQSKLRKRRVVRVLSGLLAASVLLVAVLGMVYVPRFHARQQDILARSNLHRLGLAFKMYANESPGGQYPPVAPYPGVWAPDLSVLYPLYVPDPQLLVDPTLPNASRLRREILQALEQSPPDFETAARIAAQSFVYTGHALRDEAEVQALREQRLHIAQAQPPPAPGPRVRPLREGVERFLITDINNPAASASAQAQVPVLFQTHRAVRASQRPVHVLYMDGHVASLDLGSAFPALPAVLEAFPPPPIPPPGSQ